MAGNSKSFIQEVFTDYTGGASFGRLAAGYCIVGALLVIQEGIMLPAMGSYCAAASGSLLLAAAGFYATSKGEQLGSNLAMAKSTPSPVKDPEAGE